MKREGPTVGYFVVGCCAKLCRRLSAVLPWPSVSLVEQGSCSVLFSNPIQRLVIPHLWLWTKDQWERTGQNNVIHNESVKHFLAQFNNFLNISAFRKWGYSVVTDIESICYHITICLSTNAKWIICFPLCHYCFLFKQLLVLSSRYLRLYYCIVHIFEKKLL